MTSSRYCHNFSCYVMSRTEITPLMPSITVPFNLVFYRKCVCDSLLDCLYVLGSPLGSLCYTVIKERSFGKPRPYFYSTHFNYF